MAYVERFVIRGSPRPQAGMPTQAMAPRMHAELEGIRPPLNYVEWCRRNGHPDGRTGTSLFPPALLQAKEDENRDFSWISIPSNVRWRDAAQQENHGIPRAEER